MQVTAIQLLYDYSYWAMDRVMDRVAAAGDERFVAPPPIGQESLRDTFLHLLYWERHWRRSWQGQTRPPQLTPADIPTLAVFAEQWAVNRQEMEAYLAGLSDEDLTAPINAIPLWTLLVHVANHGMQHRSEAATLLTHYGYSPGNIDLFVFVRQRFRPNP